MKSLELEDMYEVLGCELITTGGVFYGKNGEEDVLFADDEGLFKNPKHFFEIEGVTGPIGSKALVVGSDDEGNSTSVNFTNVEEIKKNITWAYYPGGVSV